MKKVDFMKRLSGMTGLDATKIAEAINVEGEDIALEIPNVHVFTDTELADKLKNHVEISSKTIIEKAIKEARNTLKERHGIDFEGKTIENLVSASIEAGKKEAGVKPDEKVKELNAIIETLRGNVAKVDEEWRTKYTDLDMRNKEAKRNMYLMSIFPNDLDTPFSSQKMLALFNLDIKVDEEDGKMIFKDASGNVLRDQKTQNPLKEQDVITTWLEQNNIKRKQEPGRGNGNEHGEHGTVSAINSTEDFYNYCKTNNIPQRDYGKTLIEIQKVKPEFRLT